MFPFLALACALPLAALAQESLPGLGAQPTDAPQASPVALEDVRMTIGAVIESFIEQRSPDGFWPVRDKSTKQLRHLQLLSIDRDNVKDQGSMNFSAPASLKDLKARRTIQAVFIVSFRAPEGKVVGMKLVAPRPRALRPAD